MQHFLTHQLMMLITMSKCIRKSVNTAKNVSRTSAFILNVSVFNFSALKYGITGFMIGHELSHGFDSSGKMSKTWFTDIHIYIYI